MSNKLINLDKLNIVTKSEPELDYNVDPDEELMN